MAKKKSSGVYSDYFASSAAKDSYGTIFMSMCTNEKFKTLTPAAKWFYVLCRVEWMSKDGQACLYKHADQYGRKYNPNCFVFPAKHQKAFGVDRRNGSSYIKKLIDAGLIEIEENNAHRKIVNVYRFSDKWKDSS